MKKFTLKEYKALADKLGLKDLAKSNNPLLIKEMIMDSIDYNNRTKRIAVEVCLDEGLDPYYLIVNDYSLEHLTMIVEALSKGIDPEYLCNPSLNIDQVREIYIGLFDSLDVSKYCSEKYNSLQMREISNALRNEIDITEIVDENYNWTIMWLVADAIKAGVDKSKLKSYLHPSFDYFCVEEIIKGLQVGNDVSKYAVVGYDWKKMNTIRLGKDMGYSIGDNFTADQLKEIGLAKKNGVNMSILAKEEYSHIKMKRLRKFLEKGVPEDVVIVLSEFTEPQLRGISKAINNGYFDISLVSKDMTPTKINSVLEENRKLKEQIE